VVMFGVASFTKRDTVLVVAKAVPVGSTIDASDVTTAKITSDPVLTPIPSGERDTVIGKVALVDLKPGTLFTRDELGTSDGFTTGQVLVALPLKQGQFPARGLAAGQSVLVVATPGSSSNSAGTAAGTTTPSTGTKAVVTEVGPTDASTGVTVVDVRVAANAGVPLAQLASTGNAAVILLPPGR
jgi:SAF domain